MEWKQVLLINYSENSGNGDLYHNLLSLERKIKKSKNLCFALLINYGRKIQQNIKCNNNNKTSMTIYEKKYINIPMEHAKKNINKQQTSFLLSSVETYFLLFISC